MDGSMGMGFMAVFAVSGSVAFVAIQAHKRLLSDFMKRIEFEFGYEKCPHKKRVQFIGDAREPSPRCENESNSMPKPCLKRRCMWFEGSMPLNRLALYRGIVQNKMLYPKKEYGVSRGRSPHFHI